MRVKELVLVQFHCFFRVVAHANKQLILPTEMLFKASSVEAENVFRLPNELLQTFGLLCQPKASHDDKNARTFSSKLLNKNF